VPGLAHDLDEVGAGLAGGGGEARAQRVPGEALGLLDPGIACGLADQARYRAIREPAGLAQAHEQRRVHHRLARSHGEVSSLQTDRKPALEGQDGAQPGLGVVGPDGDLLAGAVLVGLGPAHQHAQPAAGDGHDVAEAQRHQLGASQGSGEAEQQQGPVAQAERTGRGRAGGEQAAQRLGDGRGGLAPRAGASGAHEALSGWQIRSGGGTVPGMTTSPNPYRGFRFPAEVIEHAVWLYHCFSLSLRDVELILVARGIVVSYESIREWGLRFGRLFANTLKRRRPKPGDKWHLDEVFIRIRGKLHYLWRAVD